MNGTSFIIAIHWVKRMETLEMCIRDRYLLCFHNVSWEHRMKSGLTLREELTANLKLGIEQADRNIPFIPAVWQDFMFDYCRI